MTLLTNFGVSFVGVTLKFVLRFCDLGIFRSQIVMTLGMNGFGILVRLLFAVILLGVVLVLLGVVLVLLCGVLILFGVLILLGVLFVVVLILLVMRMSVNALILLLFFLLG